MLNAWKCVTEYPFDILDIFSSLKLFLLGLSVAVFQNDVYHRHYKTLSVFEDITHASHIFPLNSIFT